MTPTSGSVSSPVMADHKLLEDAARKAVQIAPGEWKHNGELAVWSASTMPICRTIPEARITPQADEKAILQYIALANPTAVLTLLEELATLKARLVAAGNVAASMRMDWAHKGWSVPDVIDALTKALSTHEAKPEAQSLTADDLADMDRSLPENWALHAPGPQLRTPGFTEACPLVNERRACYATPHTYPHDCAYPQNCPITRPQG